MAESAESSTDPPLIAVFTSSHDSTHRGMVSLQSLRQDQVLLRVPLRLALADHPDDEESNRLLYPSAPWSIRLAAKLLRERARGDASPWFDYMATLPSSMQGLGKMVRDWDDIHRIEYRPLREAMCEEVVSEEDHYRRLASLPSKASGSASLATTDLLWALSIVQSRCHGSASPDGQPGVRVRFLVPVMDFLNHSFSPNASWRLFRDDDKDEWWMHLHADRVIHQGEELFISYGPHPSDSFVQHYGFLPTEMNAHDHFELFRNLDDAMSWWMDRFGQSDEVLEAASVAFQGVEAALNAEIQQVASNQQVSNTLLPVEELYGESIKLLPNGQMDRRILAAFEAAWDATRAASDAKLSSTRAAEMALAMRCAQLVVPGMTESHHDSSCFSTALMDDFKTLLRTAPSEQANYYVKHQQFYRNALRALEDAQGASPEELARASRDLRRSMPPPPLAEQATMLDAALSEEDEALFALLNKAAPPSTFNAASVASPSSRTDAQEAWVSRLLRQLYVEKKMILTSYILSVSIRSSELKLIHV